MNEEPWELPYTPWNNRTAFYTYLRGGFRKAIWARHPVKLAYIQANRFKAPMGKVAGKDVWCCECELCGRTFPQGQCEIDHLQEAGSLRSPDDIRDFVVRLSFVDFNDIRILDKTCHKIVSYAQRESITFNEANIEKAVIAACKDKRLRDKLLKAGYSEGDVSNGPKRRGCAREMVVSGKWPRVVPITVEGE